MTPKEFYDGPMRALIERADAIMRPKMVDYAGDDDFAANFKRTAERAGLTPAQVWLVFADKHWGSVSSFVRYGRVESEDVRERLADLVNYCCLLYGMVEAGIVGADS